MSSLIKMLMKRSKRTQSSSLIKKLLKRSKRTLRKHRAISNLANFYALKAKHPWIKNPMIVSAPMRPFAQSDLAIAVTKEGGLGLISNGPTLKKELEIVKNQLKPYNNGGDIYPIGVGFQLFVENLDEAIKCIQDCPPAAIWLFGPKSVEDLRKWHLALSQAASNRSTTWIQVGSIKDALEAVEACGTDIVLVAQGIDAGGHGLIKGSSIMTLLPGIKDALKKAGHSTIPVLAAGGIVDARGIAAATALGADGVVMGTRFLASKEAAVPAGIQNAIIEAKDGGQDTVRTRLFDTLRGVDWPEKYDARALINKSVVDSDKGMTIEENRKLFSECSKDPNNGFGVNGRLMAYGGTGVGMIDRVKSVKEIFRHIRRDLGLE